jgi:hypothetical protein
MQRATTVSNSLRRRSLSRKRPWRFLENVEWAGNVAVEPQPAEPPVGRIEVDLLAQQPLRANAEAKPTISIRIISGIDRRASDLAVIGP